MQHCRLRPAPVMVAAGWLYRQPRPDRKPILTSLLRPPMPLARRQAMWRVAWVSNRKISRWLPWPLEALQNVRYGLRMVLCRTGQFRKGFRTLRRQRVLVRCRRRGRKRPRWQMRKRILQRTSQRARQ